MPAIMFGKPGKEHGDQLLYEMLEKGLPDGAIVYAQPELVFGAERRAPDYVVIYPNWGVIVLEVKDWTNILEIDKVRAHIKRKNGASGWETSPVIQAKKAAQLLERMLQSNAALLNYRGQLAFSYAYGGVLPFFNDIAWLEKEWGKGYVLGPQDLNLACIAKSIENIPVPFRQQLKSEQVKIIRAIVDPQNIVKNPHTGEFKGIYDLYQEAIAKEELRRNTRVDEDMSDLPVLLPNLENLISFQSRSELLEKTVPDEVKALRSDAQVRLVRGFAGTGKTDVLVMRAGYIYKSHPDMQILVTTFNKRILEQRLKPELKELQDRIDVRTFDALCADIYRKKHGRWIMPQNSEGLITRMAKDIPDINQFGGQFLADEFCWMKEAGRTWRADYVRKSRDGRGGTRGRSLSRKMKQQVFDLFEAYQRELDDIPALDWADLHEKVLRYLEAGIAPQKTYDAILIDEGQHFAPGWMKILFRFLKPDGYLFICDDPSQSVYRHFSWRQKHVEVVGHTKWLKIPYRNTRQIFEAAYSLIKDDKFAQQLLAESGEAVSPELKNRGIRKGKKPQVHEFTTWEAERDFVSDEIQALIKSGILPTEIAILHTQRYVIEKYRSKLPSEISVLNAREQTGTEYRVIFVPKVQEIASNETYISWKESQSRQRLQFYMLMTRSRDYLYLLYEQKWPKELESVLAYSQITKH